MPVHREQLGPVDGFETRIDWQTLLEQWYQRSVRWILGAGFLSMHLAVFGVSFLTVLTWNLIVDPADLAMVEPFRYWGTVAIIHTILLGGGLIGWKMLRMDQPDRPRFMVPAQEALAARAESARTSTWQTAWTRGMVSAARVNTTARRWATAPVRRADGSTPARDAETGWPEQPAIFRTAPAESEHADTTAADVGEATWPASAPISTTLSGSAGTNPADEVVSVDHRDAGESADDQHKTWIDGFVESRSKDKEHRWSWVEAAAASWLSRRELEGKSEKALSAGADEAESSAPVPDQGESDGSETPSA
jgi:hypothetical protein